MLSPLVVFVYNRIDHAEKTLESLSKCEFANETEVFIFSDAAKNEQNQERVDSVRSFIRSGEFRSCFKSVRIIEAEKNKGLARSIIEGVTQIINAYGRVIVVEDDNIVGTDFLKFMNDCLDFYENNHAIWSIGSYNIMDFKGTFPHDTYKEDVYILGRTCSYSWASWKDRWNKVDWDIPDYKFNFLYNPFKRRRFNKFGSDRASMLDYQMAGLISSWAIRFDYAEFLDGSYTVYPSYSKSYNIGLDGSGTHNKAAGSTMQKYSLTEHDYKLAEDLEVQESIRKIFNQNFYTAPKSAVKQYIKAYIYRIKNRINGKK